MSIVLVHGMCATGAVWDLVADELRGRGRRVEVAARARTTLRSQAMMSFIEAPPRVAWRQTPSTFVIGRYDRVFNRKLMEEMASRAATVIEWDTSHSPMLSRPDLVVDLLGSIDAGLLTPLRNGR